MRRQIIGSAVLVAAIAAGCSDSSGPPGAPAHLTIVSDSAPTGTVHQELSSVITVRVTDANAVPVPNAIVNFVIVKGGGHVFAGSAITPANGEVKERWTLGDIAGEQILEARAVNPVTGAPIVFARVTANALPGPLSKVTFAKRYVLTFADSTFNHGLSAIDQYSNQVEQPAIATPDQGLTITSSTQMTVTGLGLLRMIAQSPSGPDTLFVLATIPKVRVYATWRFASARMIETGDLAIVTRDTARVGGELVSTVRYSIKNIVSIRVPQSGSPDTVFASGGGTPHPSSITRIDHIVHERAHAGNRQVVYAAWRNGVGGTRGEFAGIVGGARVFPSTSSNPDTVIIRP